MNGEFRFGAVDNIIFTNICPDYWLRRGESFYPHIQKPGALKKDTSRYPAAY